MYYILVLSTHVSMADNAAKCTQPSKNMKNDTLTTLENPSQAREGFIDRAHLIVTSALHLN